MKGTSWSLWPVNFTVVVLAHVFKLGLFYVFGEEIKPSHGLYTISDSLIGEANAQRRQHNKEKRLSRRPTDLIGEWTRYPKKKDKWPTHLWKPLCLLPRKAKHICNGENKLGKQA